MEGCKKKKMKLPITTLSPEPPKTTQTSAAKVIACHTDLLLQILLRLPLISIVKFKSVSKEWHSLLTSPYFFSLRFQNPNTTLLPALLLHPTSILARGNCLARSLTTIALDALKAGHETVEKVRDCVKKYVKTLEEKFIPSAKTLALDDQSQWNTTYEMLLAALELKDVFSCRLDSKEWKVMETLCTYLKLVFDAASLLTTPIIPTLNIFFLEAWEIQLELAHAATSGDPLIRNLTEAMRENFDKYWKNSCLILAIAVAMDPRIKMKLVEYIFSKIHGDAAGDYIKNVEQGVHELFLEYVALPLPLTQTSYIGEEEAIGGDAKGDDLSNGLTDFDVFLMESFSQQSKTELYQYLEESLLPWDLEFDAVGWWELNKSKYPTLSKMARDLLSLPVSTVGGDSVFNTASSANW